VTCIVGLVDADGVHIGADSIAIAPGADMVTRAQPKVFKLDGPAGQMLFGCAGSLRFRDVLQYRFEAPVPEPGQTTHAYMATSFIDALAGLAHQHGLLHDEQGIKEMKGSELLVAYRGALFEIEQDFQVGVNLVPFASVGLGRQIALGAMYATTGQPTKKRLRAALKAAEAFCGGVRGPFRVLSLPKPRAVTPFPIGETSEMDQ
jgi:ATP-dependent protease HslVU (ClpYQ) peptidase subunit